MYTYMHKAIMTQHRTPNTMHSLKKQEQEEWYLLLHNFEILPIIHILLLCKSLYCAFGI